MEDIQIQMTQMTQMTIVICVICVISGFKLKTENYSATRLNSILFLSEPYSFKHIWNFKFILEFMK